MAQVKPTARNSSRDALREALAQRDAAVRAVDAAMTAEHMAREHGFAAQHAADELRRRQAEAPESSDAVAAIMGGVDDVLALERPRAEMLAEFEAADEKVRAWRNAADGAEQAIPVREAACARAEVAVRDAANAVITGSLDIDKLLLCSLSTA
jgi:hypothetical protein